ncbi:MAG TPA: glycosyltransferase family 2 protein [Pyrinomonadaceae bacterium]|nr:glycosyltransferase family 2 protein [Pyrinomonadaceae bacterium]
MPSTTRERRACSISVVIPSYNEERFIGKVLENLAGQYESGLYEIIVVDGRSMDRTREVVQEYIARAGSVRVLLVDNPSRAIPSALNLGIEAARGEIIVRMDAHSIPSDNYVRRSVELLNETGAAIVGMPWRISPGADGLTARAISLAVAHPFGIGDAKYRLGGLEGTQAVDTVPFGVFRKSLWRELGGFNERLLANEDYDFHYRARHQGGRILLDTAGHSVYFARATIKELAVQYARYGRWKAQMLKLHPRSVRVRQLVAPAFVSSIVILSVLGLWLSLAWWMLTAMLAAYFGLSLFFALRLARRESDTRLLPLISLAFLVVHCAWGGSFLVGLLRPPR